MNPVAPSINSFAELVLNVKVALIAIDYIQTVEPAC